MSFYSRIGSDSFSLDTSSSGSMSRIELDGLRDIRLARKTMLSIVIRYFPFTLAIAS